MTHNRLQESIWISSFGHNHQNRAQRGQTATSIITEDEHALIDYRKTCLFQNYLYSAHLIA